MYCECPFTIIWMYFTSFNRCLSDFSNTCSNLVASHVDHQGRILVSLSSCASPQCHLKVWHHKNVCLRQKFLRKVKEV